MKEKFLKYLYKRLLKIFFDKVERKEKLRSEGFARDFEEMASHESTRKTPKPWLEFSFGAYKKNFKR